MICTIYNERELFPQILCSYFSPNFAEFGAKKREKLPLVHYNLIILKAF